MSIKSLPFRGLFVKDNYYCYGNTSKAAPGSYLPQIAFEGYESVIKYLPHHKMVLGARDETGATVLHYAALGGHLELVQYLHQQGADIHARNNEGTTLLHAAAICGKLTIVCGSAKSRDEKTTGVKLSSFAPHFFTSHSTHERNPERTPGATRNLKGQQSS